MTTDRLKENLVSLGFAPSEEQLLRFVKYYELLIERNKVMNLTAITDWDEAVTKHFVDSVAPFGNCVPELFHLTDVPGEVRVLDIGTGAGFPAIPLKIMFPEVSFVLFDALNKRVDFLNEVITALGLSDITAIHGRAEDLGRTDVTEEPFGRLREGFDIVVSRAVSRMSVLSEYCIPFVKPEGYFVAYKSEKAAEELFNAKNAIDLLGGGEAEIKEYLLPDTRLRRSVIIVKKISPTPEKYPRRAGKPEKKPL